MAQCSNKLNSVVSQHTRAWRLAGAILAVRPRPQWSRGAHEVVPTLGWRMRVVVEPATPGKARRRSGRIGRSVAQAEEDEDLGEGEADAGGGDSGAAPARLLPRHDSAGGGCGVLIPNI